jgi:hypothetical protein
MIGGGADGEERAGCGRADFCGTGFEKLANGGEWSGVSAGAAIVEQVGVGDSAKGRGFPNERAEISFGQVVVAVFKVFANVVF